MDKANAKKKQQLGMNHSTARARLVKNILFKLVQAAGLDICFQCGEKIEDIDTFTIEHKVPWLDSEDPVGIFFDLDNIAFSHHSCNAGAARPSSGNKYQTEEERLAARRLRRKEYYYKNHEREKQRMRRNKRRTYDPEERRQKYLEKGN